jgi:ribosomal protein L29
MTEINQLTNEQLLEKINDARRALFALRLNAATTALKDYSQFRKLRVSIARMQTVLNQRAS